MPGSGTVQSRSMSSRFSSYCHPPPKSSAFEKVQHESLYPGRIATDRIGRTANAALARYDGLLQGIPNPAIMLSPLTTREAVLSSRIEGTQATMDEVLEQE